jgi:tetratricopeptide (TPR) repeat protein
VAPPGSPLSKDAPWLAVAVAVLWVVHPLQTEAVTYVVQRAESLMGLCYLLTLYGFIRGAQAEKPARWFMLSIGACLLGMTAKEVMVTAPVMVLLYDRTFLAGSFRAAWRERGRVHASLAGTWLVLICLVVRTGDRGGTIGAGAGIPWWSFALTQSRAVVHYLQLALWPFPLIFDYGTDFIRRAGEVVPYMLLDGFLLALTLLGLWRRPALGFLGAWFFVILAPSSSVVGGVRQMVAEHRAYLSLAAVIMLVVAGLYVAFGRRGAVVAGLALAAGLGFVAAGRNADYRSALAIWSDTVAKRPENAWAHGNLGTVLLSLGRVPEAAAEFDWALRIKPDYAEAHNNLGNVLLRQGRVAEAMDHYRQALRHKPDYAEAHNNLANGLLQAGRVPEAIAHYEVSLRLDPNQAETHNNFGIALARTGRIPEAIAQCEEALRCEPGYVVAHMNLGNVLAQAGRGPEAIRSYEAALRLQPDYAEADFNLGIALAQQGRVAEAIARYEDALRLKPGYAAAHDNLANALLGLDRPAEAIAHYEAALRLTPADATVHYNLANALLRLRRVDEAVSHYREALRLNPGFPEARQVLDRLRVMP